MEILDNELLQMVFVYIVSGGGGGWLAYQFLEWGRIKPWLDGHLLSSEKRVLAFLLSFAVGGVAYPVMVGLRLEAVPADHIVWIQKILVAGLMAAGVSNLIHGKLKLDQ